jgi:hypothetical protein
MVAMAIFFMATFAILGLVAQNLRIARSLRMGEIDFSAVAAEVALTNRLAEGTINGDFGDFYPGASWTADVYLASSNGLYQADILIVWTENALVRTQMTSIWLYRPESSPVGGGFRR